MWAIVGGWLRLLLRWKAEVVAAQGGAEESAPRMEVAGRGNVQIGHAGGNVTVVHLTQHLRMPRQNGWKPQRSRVATDEQREVLRLLRELGEDEEVVLAWMQREFSTRLVVHLRGRSLVRARQYAEAVNRRRVATQAQAETEGKKP